MCAFTTDSTDAPLRLLVEADETTGIRETSRLMIDKLTTIVTQRCRQLEPDTVSAVVAAGSVVGGHGDSHRFGILGCRDAILVSVAGIDAEHEHALVVQDGIDNLRIASATARDRDQARRKENCQADGNGPVRDHRTPQGSGCSLGATDTATRCSLSVWLLRRVDGLAVALACRFTGRADHGAD